MVNEKRRHKRYWVKGLKSRLRERYFLGLLSKPTEEEYPCLDISESGLQFVSTKAFKPEDELLLDIFTSLSEKKPVQAKIAIAWVKRSTQLGICLVGARFVSVPRAGRAELKHMIERGGLDGEHISMQVRLKAVGKAHLVESLSTRM
ncbi:MAG: PilZ domain-containing protein [Candidatus Brocadiia bacterium]